MDLIRCPITLEPLRIASPALVETLQKAVREQRQTNRIGAAVTDDFQSGLINASGTWFYPVVDEIPTLICDEAINTMNLTTMNLKSSSI